MKTQRCAIRLHDELAQKIKEYAKRHQTTVTALVELHFVALLEEEERNLALIEIEVGKQI